MMVTILVNMMTTNIKDMRLKRREQQQQRKKPLLKIQGQIPEK
jgi:hypothetical protein